MTGQAPQSFTLTGNGLLRVLATNVGVTQAYALGTVTPPQPQSFVGIWDTGASGTVVTQKVVDACGLVPRGIEQVFHAQGDEMVNNYLINVFLPNGIMVWGLKVTFGKMRDYDLLIGMDPRVCCRWARWCIA